MVKSMTGYGQSKLDSEEVNLSVEIKSLNSKFLDTTIKLPREFSDKELEVKNLLTERLVRGKVNIAISFSRKDVANEKIEINERLLGKYIERLKSLTRSFNTTDQDIFKLAIQMPDVLIQQDLDEDLEPFWQLVLQNIESAIDKCDEFRLQEGEIAWLY